MRKFRINVNGTSYDVEVEEIGAGSSQAVSAPVAAAPVAPKEEAKPVQNTNVAGTKIEAPMPGTILGVNVAQGDAVSEGDVLCILEAMKMENEIVSPCNGKVAAINIDKGQNVNTGDVLIVIE